MADRTHIWRDWPSMKHIDPLSEPNPVTLIENYLIEQGSLVRRSGFTADKALVTVPINHVNAYTQTTGDVLVLKSGTSFFYRTSVSGSWTQITSSAVNTPDTTHYGSFFTNAGDIYYFDRNTAARWDGSGAMVEPGVPYFDLGGYSAFTYDRNWNPGDDARYWLQSGAPTSDIVDGGKSGSFAVSYSWYDPKRGIYGRRSKSETEHIAVFYDDQNIKLHGREIVVPTPDPVESGYEIACWVSQSVNISARVNDLAAVYNTNDVLVGFDYTFALSYQPGEYIQDVHFFEAWADNIGDTVAYVKDNASLARSGQATDTFERPHPCECAGIFPDGTAIYYMPDLTSAGGGTQRQLAEYSFGHPEQIGRDCNVFPFRRPLNGETTVPISNLRGRPVYHDGNLLLTTQGYYRMQLIQGNLVIFGSDIGRGVRSEKSITKSPIGVSYMSDAGHILLGGEGSTVADELLGYSDYLPGTAALRSLMCGGAVLDWIFLWGPDINPDTGTVISENQYAAMVYDHAAQRLTRFKLGDVSLNVGYSCGATLSGGSRLYVFDDASDSSYRWPSGVALDNGSTFHSKVVMWLNDAPEYNKTIEHIAIQFGDCDDPNYMVIVEGFDNVYNTSTGYTKRAVTGAASVTDIKNRRVVLTDFSNMHGRVFRITVGTNDASEGGTPFVQGDMTVRSVQVDYDIDDSSHHEP